MDIYDNPANGDVLAYLQQDSTPTLLVKIAPHSDLAYTDYTHPDLADLLIAASKHLPGHRARNVYGFLVLANATGTICAVAQSMLTLAFRLSVQSRLAALELGAQTMEKCGEDWVEFNPWTLRVTDEERIAHFRSWCEQAYTYAESLL